jgi:L-aminopeptidase/D-esterase-like protein
VALAFDPEAAERWKSLCASNEPYERGVRAAVGAVLRGLDEAPGLHRVGAIQFGTTPTTWARTVDVGTGADWIVIWTTDPGDEIRILRIEPAPSL